jgi:hypothetical protein
LDLILFFLGKFIYSTARLHRPFGFTAQLPNS